MIMSGGTKKNREFVSVTSLVTSRSWQMHRGGTYRHISVVESAMID